MSGDGGASRMPVLRRIEFPESVLLKVLPEGAEKKKLANVVSTGKSLKFVTCSVPKAGKVIPLPATSAPFQLVALLHRLFAPPPSHVLLPVETARRVTSLPSPPEYEIW